MTGPPGGSRRPEPATRPSGPSAALSPLGRAHLDELLHELLQRVGEVMDTQERLRWLLDAVVGLAADLSLDSVLQRIVTVACKLTDAKYGALGVLGAGPDRRLREFVTHGLDPAHRRAIGELPRGRGILGVLIDDPRPLRLSQLGKESRSFGFPANHPPMGSFLGVPIRIQDKVFGNLYLTSKGNDEDFTEDDEQVVIALAAAAGVVVENARLYEEGERRQRWLGAAAAATAALLGSEGRDDALQVVAERARESADADMAAVLLRHTGGRLLVEAVAGAHVEALVGTDLLLEGTAAGEVLTSGRPVVVDDAHGRGQVAASGLPVVEDGLGLSSVAMLPLRSGGRVAGILALGWKTGREQLYRDTDLRLPESFADQTALALQVAQAQQDQGRLAVLEDRDRIARDLHDVVVQRLFAIGLTLQNATRRTDDPDGIAAGVNAAVTDIDSTITDIRHSIFELSAAGSTSVRAELGAGVAEFASPLGFTPRLQTRGPVDTLVPPHVRPHMMAVLREALSNVARHARASSTQVLLEVGEEVVLTVSDDGTGFVRGPRESGLRNMRERAEALGGVLSVHGESGAGTVVRWSVPAG